MYLTNSALSRPSAFKLPSTSTLHALSGKIKAPCRRSMCQIWYYRNRICTHTTGLNAVEHNRAEAIDSARGCSCRATVGAIATAGHTQRGSRSLDAQQRLDSLIGESPQVRNGNAIAPPIFNVQPGNLSRRVLCYARSKLLITHFQPQTGFEFGERRRHVGRTGK